jgi:L-asparaginase
VSPRISVLATGGTISTQATAGGFVPRLGAEQLLGSVAGSTGVDLRHRDVLRVSSSAITPLDMWLLSQAVAEEIRAGADGVVVTHGTDTIEETAYALELLGPRSVPVVLTGAMRVPGAPGADGPANVAAAIVAAADHRLAPYGPVVVFQDEVHLARYVTKLHSTRVAAFASPAAGPVAMIVESQLVLLHGPPPGRHVLPQVAEPARRVELFLATSGADGFVVDAIADGIDGLVVAGSGGGHVSPLVAEALLRLVGSGTPVVLASRAPSPRVLRRTYGSVGSEMHLLSGGLLAAGSLGPLKARLRLLFGLSAGLEPAELFPPDER